MSLVRWAFIGLLVLPGAEMLVFVLVGAAIGWLKAVILLVTPSIIGVMLLKRSGSREVARLARVLRTEGMFALRLDSPGVAGILATILLIIPGFLTDMLGVILLVPALRSRAFRAFAAIKSRRNDGDRVRPLRPGVIDLHPGEWRQVQEQQRTSRAKSGDRTSSERKPSRRLSKSREKQSGG